MRIKAIIISLKGERLTKMEKKLLSNERPWGVILFKRNLKSLNQIKNLTNEIKVLTKNKNFPIIIDEEGESVSRLKNIINHNISSEFFGTLIFKNKNFGLKIYEHYLSSLSNILTRPILNLLCNFFTTSSK